MKRVALSVLLASLLASGVWAAGESEPNDVGGEVKFEVIDKRVTWTVKDYREDGKERVPVYYDNPGPVRPTHVAEVIIARESYPARSAQTVLRAIEKSPIAKKLSRDQQDFVRGGAAIWVDLESHRLPGHFSTWLYAVSEADARLVGQAYLDGLNRAIGERLAGYKEQLAKYQHELDNAQRELPKKQAQLKVCEDQYGAAKKARHEFEPDQEAFQSAQKTVTEMDRTLDALEIELIGIREKLKAVEQFRRSKSTKDLDSRIHYKLDEMFIEQTIELKGLEARRQLAEVIRAKERRFLSLLIEQDRLRSDVKDLEKLVRDRTNRVAGLQNQLDDPKPYWLPPKVYQNKVVIHRIKGGYTKQERERFENFQPTMEMYGDTELDKLMMMEAQKEEPTTGETKSTPEPKQKE